jgi:hypothetical protein
MESVCRPAWGVKKCNLQKFLWEIQLKAQSYNMEHIIKMNTDKLQMLLGKFYGSRLWFEVHEDPF